MDIGKRITELRTQRNLTTNKLANLSGVSQSYLRDVELGNKHPTVEFLSYICHGLQISLYEFFAPEQVSLDPSVLDALQKLTLDQQRKLAAFLNTMYTKN